jgi:hypothetical protein
MALIDTSYFVGELNIPDTDNPNVAERLTFFISKYEEQLLRNVLGNALYAAYVAGIAAATPDQKWLDLRDGKTYTDQAGKTKYWMGFRKASTKQSLIAPYVYYWYQRDRVTITSGIGEVESNADNSSKVASPGRKMMRAWNEMADLVCDLVHFLNTKVDDYPQWKEVSSYCVLKEFRPINCFGI